MAPIEPVKVQRSVVLDVPSIAGKSKSEVESKIGVAECDASRKISESGPVHGERCTFSKSGAEIVFIDGKADWITANAMSTVSFDVSAIESLALPPQPPTFKSEHVIRWENIPGYLSVSVNPGADGKVFFAYIKVATK